MIHKVFVQSESYGLSPVISRMWCQKLPRDGHKFSVKIVNKRHTSIRYVNLREVESRECTFYPCYFLAIRTFIISNNEVSKGVFTEVTPK